MNKNCHRIIFNKVRGLLMAVAETCSSQGKACGETPAASGSGPEGRSLNASIRPLTFLVWSLLGLILPPSAPAQIVADPTAAGALRPTVLSAPNGVPLVNVQTPSAAGVSRNIYSQFDVQPQGVILNNSRSNVQTQLGGWVQGNPWHAAGSARVILNEVNASNASQLRGYVEVAGQRAQVVIANPAGVTCDGCGFINASRATITTGTPILNGGNLDGFRVQGGVVTITGNGMDASRTDYTELIARAVQINAGLWANRLKVIAGTNQIAIDPGSQEPGVSGAAPASGPAPAFAIDTAQLGGMYAGLITLVATEAGVGVRNAGTLYAGVGDVIITASGQLVNAGRIASSGQTRIDTQGGVQNTGTVHVQGSTVITTRGDILNSGVIAAQNDTALSATGASSRISSTPDAVLAAGVRPDGTLGTTGQLTLSATQSIVSQGQVLSGGDQTLSARSVDLTGSQVSAGQLSITAAQGDINLTRATVTASRTLAASASQTLRTDGADVSADQIQASAHELSNQQGQIVQTGSGEMVLDLPGDLNNTQGRIATHSTQLRIAAGTLINTGGTLVSNGAVTVTANSLNNTDGQITAGDTLTLSTQQATQNPRGLLAANGSVTLTAGEIHNASGTIGSVRDAVNVTALAGALYNSAGRVEAAKATTVFALGIHNTDGTITGQRLTADSQGQALNNTRGQIIASGTGAADGLQVQSGALINDAGLIQSASALTLDTQGQTLSNVNSGARGGIVGQGAVHLSAGDLTNQAGYIGSGSALTVTGGTITNTQGGALVSSAAATLRAQSLYNQGGQVQAVGDLDLTLTGDLHNAASLVRSGQRLSISAAAIHNTGTQGAQQGLEGNNVTLFASAIDNTAGAIRANLNATLTSSGTIGNANGLMSAGGTLTLEDAAASPTLSITNTGGTLIAGQQLTVDSARLSGDGKLLSQGDLSIRLRQSLTHSGQITADGNVTLQTDATLTNQGTLAAGKTLSVQAASIDNQATGTITAASLRLQATDSHTLTNRGTINGTETVLDTLTLYNLGTGRIYGDHVAIAAGALTNAAENGVAPVIAARDRLDIGAATIINSGHAILFSGGDLAMGGSLDASQRATGQATTLHNDGATIEALGSADIRARTLHNTNRDFATTTVSLPDQSLTEYQGAGAPTRYAAGAPDVYIYNDESDHLHTPEGNYESWTAYSYTRSTTETRVARSDPGQISAGGAMRITADTVLNDKSRIIAGGALTGAIRALQNVEVAGERITTDVGSATSYWRDHQKGRDTTGSSSASYSPPATIEAISLTPTVYQQNTATGGAGGTGTTIAALTTVTVQQMPSASGSATGSRQGGQTVTPITQVPGAAPATVVRSGGINTRVPDSSLFRLTPGPTSHYLVETDPAFASYRTWLSSDYLLSALSIDPALTQKRLGDGFYEQKLIREQVAQLTGRRFLDGYANDEAQFAALMDSGVAYAKAYSLVPGVALSAAQMAQLTSDIVWLVARDITLPDGSTTQALVPQLYVRVQDGDLQSGGALIAGNSVQMNISGDLLNGGTIAGRQVVSLTADNIHNLGGRILGNDVAIAAKTDLNNIGGTIAANNSLAATAGRDLNVASTTRTQTNAQGARTHIERVAGLYVSGGAGALIASAGRDLNLIAAAIQNQGTGATTLTAGNNLNLGTATQSQSQRIDWNGANSRSESSTAEVGTSVQTQGDLTLRAGNDLNAKAASVTSAQGSLVAAAGNDVKLTAGKANVQVDEAHQHTGRSSIFARTTVTTRDTLDQTTAQATTLSGKTVTVQAERDVTITGSNVVSDAGTTLAAKNNLSIVAANNTTEEAHFRDEKKSGIFSSGGIGFTIGRQQQSTDQTARSTTASASTVGAVSGDVTLTAGGSYRQSGSDVLAPDGDVSIAAKDIQITEARETNNSTTEQRFRQSGLRLQFTSPVISAVQTVQGMAEAAGNTRDSRMQALAAVNSAVAIRNAANAIQAGQGVTTADGKTNQVTRSGLDGSTTTADATAADKAGGLNLAISIGGSSSQSTTTQTRDTARGSTIAAGGSVSITARGAGADSDLLIQGSDMTASKDATLSAEGDVSLRASNATQTLSGNSSSGSGSLGFSVGTSGVGVTASASAGKGNEAGNDSTYTNTHVTAGEQVRIQSGADTTMQGAVVKADTVKAEVGGSLSIQSLQDTSDYASRQQSVGGSITVGAGAGGSFNASRGKVDSAYTSVTETSGMQAGDGGFQVNVGKDTNLTGAVIASSQSAVDAGKNSFSTGGKLTTTDIQNSARYSASSNSVGVGIGQASKDLGIAGVGMGVGRDSGNASSTTTAGISGIAGDKSVRSTDAGTGIAKIFDKERVQREVEAQARITEAFGRNASKAIGDHAGQQARQLREQAAVEADPDKRQAMLDDAGRWEEGGSYRVLAHTLVGGLTGGAAGAAGAASTSLSAGAINTLVSDLPPALRTVVGSAVAAGLGAAVGGSTGVATALNADLNNRQLHPTETQWIKDNAKNYARQQGISEDEAIRLLALQAYRQVQFGAEGAWDASASAFLSQAKGMLPADGATGPGYLFHATPAQKADLLMYAGALPKTADIYIKAGLKSLPHANAMAAALASDTEKRQIISTLTLGAGAASSVIALASVGPTLLTWALTHPDKAVQIGLISAEAGAGIASGAITSTNVIEGLGQRAGRALTAAEKAVVQELTATIRAVAQQKVVALQEQRVGELALLFNKTSSANSVTVGGKSYLATAESNLNGTTKVFDTTALPAAELEKQVFVYAGELAGGASFKAVDQGVWVAKLADGTTINVRSVSSSQVGRWTVDVKDSTTIENAAKKANGTNFELKFK